MPEYLAPGVFVEESGFAGSIIAGVDTDTTAFVGPCRFGPVGGVPARLTSYAEFERLHGGLDALDFGTPDSTPNYLAHAVRAFFEEGGRLLHVARVYSPPRDGDGIARWSLNHAIPGMSPRAGIELRARYPGAAGSIPVTLTFEKGQSKIRFNRRGKAKLAGVKEGDVVWAQTIEEAASTPPVPGGFYRVRQHRRGLRLGKDNAGTVELTKARFFEAVHSVSITVAAAPAGQAGTRQVWADLEFDPDRLNSLSRVFAAEPAEAAVVDNAPLILSATGLSGDRIATVLAQLPNDDDGGAIEANLDSADSAARSATLQLSGGSDGQPPTAADYSGSLGGAELAQGLRSLQALEAVSIVAAPGASASPNGEADAMSIQRALIAHCKQQRYRMAVLDSPPGAALNEVRSIRRNIDSSHAALYYPWVQILDPQTGSPMYNPPSGHICGIYARNDSERGVHKAPANEVIRLATGFELVIDRAQQRLLNPEGINCLRLIAGRGYRVWGARTLSSDPEWKYVNLRRYFTYLERSIDIGTQWTVFENNDQSLWDRVRGAIENFLYGEWRLGRIQGDKPDHAYFVRCDRSSMTQNDLDNGRLICLVGVAAVKPAEFIIFRIGQKTADSAS